MFTVVIAEKEGAERRVTFAESEVTIGRVPGNDVVLPKGNVSKRHSRIVLKDNRFIVVDLKSTNGTYVNGRKITSPLVVKEGDKIYVGDYVLTLEGAPALDGLKPPSILPMHTLSDANASMLGVHRLHHTARETLGDADDEDLPAVLRGASSQSSIPATAVARASNLPIAAVHQPDDEGEDLASESELEVFEEHAAPAKPPGAEAPAPVFPPPIEPHVPERHEQGTPQRGVRAHDERLLGPLDAVLADTAVFHVVVERFDRIRADRGAGLKLEPETFASPEALVRVAQDLRARAGLGADVASYDISLANGLQVVAVLPAAANNGAVISVRRRPTRIAAMTDLESDQLVSGAVRARLELALADKRHVWIVGPSGVDLAGFVASALDACPTEDRIALFERAPEVALGERSAICLKHGVIPFAELLERAHAFRPDRLAFHGLRESDLASVLDPLAHRPESYVASLEARSAQDALSAFDRTIGPDLTLRATSLLVELKLTDDGATRAVAAYDIELDAAGELTLKG